MKFVADRVTDYSNVLIKLNDKILWYRSGDGVVPGIIDYCVQSMALFEESEFTIEEIDKDKLCGDDLMFKMNDTEQV